MSDFRVDESAALHKGGMGGPLFIVGHPEVSLITHRLEVLPSDDDHMPPPNKPQLSKGEIDLVAAWIKAGGDDAAFAPATLSVPEQAAIGAILPASSEPSGPIASTAPSASAVPSSTGTGNGPITTPPRGGDCAACAIGGVTDGTLPVAAIASLVLAALGRRKKRRDRAA